MSIRYCNRCQTRIAYDNTCEDIIHVCKGSEVLKNEDVPIVGDWADSGSTGVVNNVMMLGITNNIWGTRGAIEGNKVSDKTSRGVDKDTHRTRQREEFIVLK